MADLLREARDIVTKDLIEQSDKKILFDIWYNEQKKIAKKYDIALKPDKRVLQFIFDAQESCGKSESETIRKFFHAGYCYYFALMLRDAFSGGHLVWMKPFGHICYMYQGLPYDIEGIYVGDGEPVLYDELGPTLEQFRHRGMDNALDEEMREFAYSHDFDFNEMVHEIYELVPDEDRIEGYELGTAMKYFNKYKDML